MEQVGVEVGDDPEVGEEEVEDLPPRSVGALGAAVGVPELDLVLDALRRRPGPVAGPVAGPVPGGDWDGTGPSPWPAPGLGMCP